MGNKPLLSGHGHLVVVPMREPLLSPLLSCHQSLDTLSLASFEEFDEGEIHSGIEGDCQL